MLGHSVGEYAAACVAGVFTLEEGLRLIARRGRLMGNLPRVGKMAAIFAPAERVTAVVAEELSLSIAAYNGAHTVISGPTEAVEALMERFAAEGVRCLPLVTSHAFHSALLEPMLDDLEAVAGKVDYQLAEMPLVSNLSGRTLPNDHLLDGSYWRRHARQPVQFARSVQTLAELGCGVLVEIGPHPVLTGMAAGCWPGESSPTLVASLQRDVADSHQLCEAMAQLYVHGLTPDFAALDRPWQRHKLELPTYPFQRQRYWVDTDRIVSADGASSPTLRLFGAGQLELLQRKLPFWGELDHGAGRGCHPGTRCAARVP